MRSFLTLLNVSQVSFIEYKKGIGLSQELKSPHKIKKGSQNFWSKTLI